MSSQTQIGQTILGTTPTDRTGTSIDLSSDGTVLAVGSPDFNISTGYVNVYRFENNQWIQTGNTLNGAEEGDSFGDSVVLSHNGEILAVGSPFKDSNGINSGEVIVYRNINSSWIQLGNPIIGEFAGDNFGNDIALSADGNILAIGALNNSETFSFAGHVRVFNYNGIDWVQIGQDIDGFSNSSFLGERLDLSADGLTLAIGVTGANNFTGAVQVYKFDNDSWEQEGSSILGEAELDQFGFGLSLSENGQRVAAGGRRNDAVALNSGHARVYANSNSNWLQIGTDLDGSDEFDFFGIDVSLSGNGTVLAVGGSGFDTNGLDSGVVKIYQQISDEWVQIGSSINGSTAGSRSGRAISLSSDGTVLAIGSSEFNDGTGEVRVFTINNVLSNNEIVNSIVRIHPNPAKEFFNVEMSNPATPKSVYVYNQIGQLVHKTKESRVYITHLPSGLYYIEIQSSLGMERRKIILE